MRAFAASLMLGTLNALSAVLIFFVFAKGSATEVPSNPTYPSPWTSRKGSDRSRNKESVGGADDNERARLEEYASRDIRDTFGEEFLSQLDEEQEIVRSVQKERARICRDAGCSPDSPLTDPNQASTP